MPPHRVIERRDVVRDRGEELVERDRLRAALVEIDMNAGDAEPRPQILERPHGLRMAGIADLQIDQAHHVLQMIAQAVPQFAGLQCRRLPVVGAFSRHFDRLRVGARNLAGELFGTCVI
jgi:hypothetical protein